MNLFRGNERGHGFGESFGIVEDPNKPGKKKYRKPANGACGLHHRKADTQEFTEHLTGVRMIGNSGLMDDGKTWRGEFDIDDYELDYGELMQRVRSAGLPLVGCRTKSGGVRLIVFFTETIEALVVRSVLNSWRSLLGLGDTEVFPKQDAMDNVEKYPSWTFLPYGPQFDQFCEQCGMNEQGGALLLEEWLDVCEKNRIDKDTFLKYANGDGTGRVESGGARKRGTGKWVVSENYEATLEDTFYQGPPCLKILSRHGAPRFQHNYLFNCAIFLKKKYPDNWEEALEWANTHVLKPVGDRESLRGMIRDHKTRKGYHYLCKDQPICDYCDSEACRKKPYGVGKGIGANGPELGMTVIDRGDDSFMFIVNVGSKRIRMTTDEIMNVKRYQNKCFENGVEFPENMADTDWKDCVKKARNEAIVQEASELFRPHATELEIMEAFFGRHIVFLVRSKGQEFLDGKVGDVVRVKVNEERIYFKHQALLEFVRRSYSASDEVIKRLRIFIEDHAIFHNREIGKGWYRSTHSVQFNELNPELVQVWLNPGTEEAQ
jgi:hypothetical protein